MERFGSASVHPGLEENQYNKLAKDKKDPFLRLGYGLIAYRKLLRSLIVMFFLMSLIMAPAIYIYYKGTGFDQMENATWSARFSLGNLGYDSV